MLSIMKIKHSNDSTVSLKGMFESLLDRAVKKNNNNLSLKEKSKLLNTHEPLLPLKR